MATFVSDLFPDIVKYSLELILVLKYAYSLPTVSRNSRNTISVCRTESILLVFQPLVLVLDCNVTRTGLALWGQTCHYYFICFATLKCYCILNADGKMEILCTQDKLIL